MQIEHVNVLNVKCAGCASNIQKGLTELDSVSDVKVSIDNGEVTVTGNALNRDQLTDKLAELGYPES